MELQTAGVCDSSGVCVVLVFPNELNTPEHLVIVCSFVSSDILYKQLGSQNEQEPKILRGCVLQTHM